MAENLELKPVMQPYRTCRFLGGKECSICARINYELYQPFAHYIDFKICSLCRDNFNKKINEIGFNSSTANFDINLFLRK